MNGWQEEDGSVVLEGDHDELFPLCCVLDDLGVEPFLSGYDTEDGWVIERVAISAAGVVIIAAWRCDLLPSVN